MLKLVVMMIGIIPFLSFAAPQKPFVTVAIHSGNTDSAEVIVWKYGKGLDFCFRRSITMKLDGDELRSSIFESDSLDHLDLQFRLPETKSSKATNFNLVVFRGDKIEFERNGNDISFRGPSGDFYQLQLNLAAVVGNRDLVWDYLEPEKQAERFDSALRITRETLFKSESAIGKRKVSYMDAELVLASEISKYVYLGLALRRGDSSQKVKVIKAYQDNHNDTAEIHKVIRKMEYDGTLAKSSLYSRFILDRYLWDSSIVVRKPLDLKKRLEYVTKSFTGASREALLIYIIGTEKSDLSAALDVASGFVKDNWEFEKFVVHRNMKMRSGRPFFNFALPNSNEKVVHLTDLRGKVVLIDMWYTGCGNCRAIHPYLDSIRGIFPNDQFVIVTISIDESKAMWLKSINAGQYTSEQNINLYTAGQGVHHPLISFYNISMYPTLFLLDRQGRLRDSPEDPRPDGGAGLSASIRAAITDIN